MAKALAGRVALVTGSTSGIGLAIARAMAAQGAKVMLHGLLPAGEVAALKSQWKQEYGSTPGFSDANVREAGAGAALVTETRAALGGCDILVNNAGIQRVAPIVEMSRHAWDDVIAINLTACFETAQAALPAMLANKYGRIVNVASVHGLVASANKGPYVAAKHGLVGLTKVIALETAGSGVTANSVCPGWVLTPLVQAQIDARAKERGISAAQASEELLSEKQPSKQFATPEDIGNTCVFLVNSPSMTGTCITVDGGWTAQ